MPPEGTPVVYKKPPKRMQTDTAWMEHRACNGMDPDLFSDPFGQDEEDLAKAVCARCTVTVECGEFGKFERRGVWGGDGPIERGFYTPRNPRKRPS